MAFGEIVLTLPKINGMISQLASVDAYHFPGLVVQNDDVISIPLSLSLSISHSFTFECQVICLRINKITSLGKQLNLQKDSFNSILRGKRYD